MAHEIHESDRFGYAGKPGWHGIGSPIPEGIDTEKAFKRLGLDWSTELLPIYGKTTEQGVSGGEILVPVPGHRAHIRSDTKRVLGVVRDTYKPLDNLELARFADSLAGEDAAVMVETAGSLYNSRRVFALVKLPYHIHAAADDRLDTYVLVANGHGGVASFSVWPTSIRVVCANTMRMSERDAGKGVRFRHTGDFDAKVELARRVLGTAKQETEKFGECVEALVNTQIKGEALRLFLRYSWEIAFSQTAKYKGEALARAHERRAALVSDWLAMMDNEKNSVKGIRGSLWSAYNAVTEWHDHVRGSSIDVQRSGTRQHSNLFGVSAVAKLKTFRHAMTLV
jgi:phage/plasmid-like protein (TIGR03299 family)